MSVQQVPLPTSDYFHEGIAARIEPQLFLQGLGIQYFLVNEL